MKFESFSSKEEKVSGEKMTEEHELDSVSEEVLNIIAENSDRLETDGQFELEGLSEGLSENDPKVVSTREHLASIAKRAKELTKWAAVALSLSATQPAVAEKAPQQEETKIVVTASAKSNELQYDNPQREGYASPDGYRRYLRIMWKDYKATMRKHGGYSRVFVEGVRDGRKLTDPEIETISGEFTAAIESTDSQREWLAQITNSPEYRRRYLENEGMSEEDLEKRRRRVAEDVIRIEDPFHQFDDPWSDKNIGVYQKSPMWSRYQDMQNRALIKKDEALRPGSNTAMHELEHHVVGGDETVSPKAAEVYKKVFNRKIYPHLVEYLSQPGEIDAYKREFEHVFEQQTEWHYGETFTQEHAKKARELFEADKLGPSGWFLKLIDEEKFEENLIEVMNTLAVNESGPEIDGRPREERV